jgi:hypothetical protein
MYSPTELTSLHGFLKSTGEGNLKKMLSGGKMTEVHVGALVKIARASTEEAWLAHWEAGTFPKVKFTPAETALKETFYGVCGEACVKMGLLPAALKAA